jgi:inorganic pyrophosphatase
VEAVKSSKTVITVKSWVEVSKMSLLNIGIGDRAPEIVNVIIEIPKGSSNKYEVDITTGIVKLDRVLYSPLFYPCEYGFIPGTLYSDGDPIDALVLTSHPTMPGCVLDCKPIGLLMMRDEKGRDDKILCVGMRDPRYNTMRSLQDVGDHVLREIVHFFEVYKQLEEKDVDVLGWDDAEMAKDIIEQFRIRTQDATIV